MPVALPLERIKMNDFISFGVRAWFILICIIFSLFLTPFCAHVYVNEKNTFQIHFDKRFSHIFVVLLLSLLVLPAIEMIGKLSFTFF